MAIALDGSGLTIEKLVRIARHGEKVEIPGVEVFVRPVQEHRFVVVFRGPGLGDRVADTDPQKTGVPPLDPEASDEASEKNLEYTNQRVSEARAADRLAKQRYQRGVASLLTVLETERRMRLAEQAIVTATARRTCVSHRSRRSGKAFTSSATSYSAAASTTASMSIMATVFSGSHNFFRN